MVKHLVIKSIMFLLAEQNSVFLSLTVHGTAGYGQKKKWYNYDLQTTFKKLNSTTGSLFMCSLAFIYVLNIEEREREREREGETLIGRQRERKPQSNLNLR